MIANVPDSVVEESATQSLLDQILDEALRTSARKPLIIEFDPSSRAIWRHWKGTIFSETWSSVLQRVIWAVLVYVLFQKFPQCSQFLDGFPYLWGHVLGVTTFTLSFFVNQSYGLWRSCLNISRTLQGRINDLMMLLSSHARRDDPTTPDSFSEFTAESSKMLRIVARYLRVFNILAYGSFTRAYRPLLTPRGLRRMVSRGLITEQERIVLKEMNVSATQRFNAVLLWIFRVIVQARKAGYLDESIGLDISVVSKIQEIRLQANSIECELRGRMPFAYAHLVQVLVDTALYLYPVSCFSSNTTLQLGVLGTALLTFCYQGLFNLSKQFLDPYHNENFWKGDDALVIDTLVAETNAGSMRWMNGLEQMPIPYKAFTTGDLDQYILPEEGYSRQESVARDEAAIETISLVSAEALSAEDYVKKAAEIREAYVEEYEETQRILNAPPASDFVPGLDDDGADFYRTVQGLESSNSTEWDPRLASDRFGQYFEATQDELEKKGSLQDSLVTGNATLNASSD